MSDLNFPDYRASVAQLMALIGTGDAPQIIDVRIDGDFDEEPLLVPTSTRIRHTEIATWQPDRPDIAVFCQKGLKLSLGAAALLRARGFRAFSIAGGTHAWRDAGLPRVQDGLYTTRWVINTAPTRELAAVVWALKRFISPTALIMAVPTGDMAAVAEKFAARMVPVASGDDLRTYLDAVGLTYAPLQQLCDRVGRSNALHCALSGALQTDDAVVTFDKTAPIFDALLAGLRLPQPTNEAAQ